jgi:hypothetical protein
VRLNTTRYYTTGDWILWFNTYRTIWEGKAVPDEGETAEFIGFAVPREEVQLAQFLDRAR